MSIVEPTANNFEVKMEFADAVPEEEVVDPAMIVAEEILLIGFIAGINRVKDECAAITSEHRALTGEITPEELLEELGSLDVVAKRSETEVIYATELINNLLKGEVDGDSTE